MAGVPLFAGRHKDGQPVGKPPVLAGNGPATQVEQRPTLYQWIDVKTGKTVATAPISGVNISGVIEGANNSVAIVSEDRRTAFDSRTGRNFAKESDGSWIDVKTGKQVQSVPLTGVNIGGVIEGANNGVAILGHDGRTAFDPRTGRNFAKEPIKQPPAYRPERGR